jgi:tetratricopeptide (TPR) repeat protein
LNSLCRYFPLVFILVFAGIENVSAQLKPEEQLAVQYYQNREVEKARDAFAALYQSNPNTFNYIYYMSCLLELKNLDEAEKIARIEMKKSPSDPRFQVDYGYILNAKGDIAKGKKIYETALKSLKPDRVQIYNLASAFQSRRESGYALATYERGRELFDDRSAFTLEIGLMHETEGNYESMLNEYLNYCLADPKQLPQIQNRLQSWLFNDTDDSKHELFRNMLLIKSQKSPDEPVYAELLLWYSVQEKDFELAFLQARALDQRYRENGSRVFYLGQMAESNDDPDIAIQAYEYVLKKSSDQELHTRCRIALLNLEFVKATQNKAWERSQLLSLEQKYLTGLSELGRNSQTILLLRNLAHLQAFYLGKTDSATAILEKTIALSGGMPRPQAECKLELADIYLFSGEQWEATLLYSQVEKAFKNDPLGHEAKFRNAKLSFYIGEFDWARAQLDILKAATSKLISNDALSLSLLISDNSDADSTYGALLMYARADLLEFRNNDREAMQVLDSIKAKYPGHSLSDEVLYKEALICRKQGDWEKAARYYSEITEKYARDILADDALFQLALLNENQLNNKDKARQLFQKLMTNYPGSLFVVDARKHFRVLRNDAVN